MTTPTGRERRSSSDVARDKAALRDLAPGFLAILLTQGTLVVLNPQGRADAWHVLWALSPLAPAMWLIWAQLRSLRRADEFQRIVQLEAMAIGFGTAITLALAGGLLDAADLADARQSLQITFLAGVMAWIGSLAVMSRPAR